ncbi:hypothetical protein ACWGOK_36570 [Streptomyces eurythermus]
MPFSTRIRREGLELAVRWRHYAPAGLGTEVLVAGIREDLQCEPAVQEPGQP